MQTPIDNKGQHNQARNLQTILENVQIQDNNSSKLLTKNKNKRSKLHIESKK